MPTADSDLITGSAASQTDVSAVAQYQANIFANFVGRMKRLHFQHFSQNFHAADLWL